MKFERLKCREASDLGASIDQNHMVWKASEDPSAPAPHALSIYYVKPPDNHENRQRDVM